MAGYGVTSVKEDDPQPTRSFVNLLSLVKVYDVETGKLLLVAPPFLVPPKPILCPPGK